MKYTLITLLFSCGIAKAQVISPGQFSRNKLFNVNDIESYFDSMAIHKYIVEGRPALTLSNNGESITCICLPKAEVGINITALLQKKGRPLVCPWPYTRSEAKKPSK